MTTETQVAESVAAQVEQTPTFDAADQTTWSGDQREEWNATGKQPTEASKKAESGAASSSESKTEQSEPKGKSAAESGAAKSQESKKEKPKDKPTADERIGVLTGENKALKDRLQKLEEEQKIAGVKAEPEKKVEPLKRPNPFTWKGTQEEYDKAMDDYEKAKEEKLVAAVRQEQVANGQAKIIAAAVEEARTRYGAEAFDAVVEPAADTIAKEAHWSVKQWIQGSQYFADLLYTIGGTPESMADFMSVAKTNPLAALRKLAFLELEIGKELAKGKAEKSKGDDKTETSAKREPRAATATKIVGGRGTTDDDPAVSAARNGDFGAFDKAMTGRHMRA